MAAASSKDVRLQTQIILEGEKPQITHCDKNSTLTEISQFPKAKRILEDYMEKCEEEGYPIFKEEPELIQNMHNTTPLRWLMMLSGGHFTGEMMEKVLENCR